MRELAADARGLDPAEREIRGCRARAVDPDHARLDPVGDPLRPFQVAREDRAA